MNLKRISKHLGYPEKITDDSLPYSSGDIVDTPDGQGKVIECRTDFVLVSLFEDNQTESYSFDDVVNSDQ